MKNILLLMSSIACLTGCGNSRTQQQATKITDSIVTIKQQKEYRQQHIIDSTLKFERLALAKKAYGNAYFEMSMNEVEKMAEFKNWHKHKTHINISSEKVGLYDYQIELWWYEDKLYYVDVKSEYGLYESATYLNTEIKEEVMNLKEIISRTYGEPTTIYGFPNIFDFTAGKTKWIYRWDIETKVILIGIEEKSTGSEYQMNAWIYYKPLYEKRVKEIEQQQQQAKSEDVGKF